MKGIKLLGLHYVYNIFFFTLLIGTVLFGCNKTDSRESELAYLRTVVPDSLLEYANLDIASRESIAVTGEGNNKHLGLRVFPGQSKVHGGIRAEISVDYPFQQGETVRYSWRFMLPNDFNSDAPENRWWVIGQWHDQPNKNMGETWENFQLRSPPILIGIGELDGRMAIVVEYGPTHNKKKGPLFIERGKWQRISLIIRWSQKEDGKAEVFLNDSNLPAYIIDGPNMHNAFQHYLKLGMYRHPDIATDNWIYVDDLEISKVRTP